MQQTQSHKAAFISVIIPCYNQGQYLDDTLQSVLKQTYSHWECIIVNDGSTDNTEEIANSWCILDNRFKYVYKENGGLSSARNAGLQHTSGNYIQFLDADDLIADTKFEAQLKDLKDAQISISNYFSFIDGDINQAAKHRYLSPFFSEKNFKKDIILDWEYKRSIPCHAVLFQRSLITENNIVFNEQLPNHEDWVFWVQLFYVSKNIKNNQNVLAFYRIRKIAMSANYEMMRYGFLKAANILKVYFKNQNNSELVKAVSVKYHEVYNKNRVPLFKKIKSKLYSNLARIYKYVK